MTAPTMMLKKFVPYKQKTLSPSEAIENVRALRDFLLMARNTSSVQCLGPMEDAFFKNACAEQRQSKISEFF